MPNFKTATQLDPAGEADQQMVRRLLAGSISYFGLAGILLLINAFGERSRLVTGIIVVLLGSAGARLVFSRSLLAPSAGKRAWYRRAFVASTYGTALSWTAFCCSMVTFHANEASVLLALTTTVVLVSGDVFALAAESMMARWYLAIVGLPLLTCCLVQNRAIGYYAAAALSWYFLFLLVQVQQQSWWYATKASIQETLTARVAELETALNDLEASTEKTENGFRVTNEFLANVSHEIRTPLNGVVGMADLLVQTELSAEQRDFVHTIRQSGDALLTVVDEILDYSNIEAGKLKLEVTDFDVRALVEKTATSVAEQAHHKGFGLGCQLAANVPSCVTGDPGRLHQVLVTLLSVAVKFTEEGELLLRVDSSEPHGGATTLHFSITDAGVGIPVEIRQQLTLAFGSVDTPQTRPQPGLGLGLALSRRLVKLMGGQIGFENVTSGGSKFWFTLPVQIAGTCASESVMDLRQARILVVDDNATNRKTLESQLTALGMTVQSVDGGRAALGALLAAQQRGEPYHAALVDHHMPQMDGISLAKTLRAQPALHDLSLILLSSHVQYVHNEELQANRFAACLPKPVRLPQLRASLSKALENMPALCAPKPAAPAAGPVRGRLLLAEDNAVNQKVAVRILQKMGYYVDSVRNGAEAVEKHEHGLYDAVLMDCQMPELDGYEATREIRRKEVGGHRTPIIAMTASAMSGDREKCLAAGMDDYVSKPVNSEELERTLQRQLGQTLQESPAAMSENGVHTDELAVRLKELEHEVGTAAIQELVAEFLSETARHVERLEESIVHSDEKSLAEALQVLVDTSSNIGAARLTELCSQLAQQGNPLEACVARFSELLEAHRSVINELQTLYPASYARVS